ncbi:MAG: hypothetical protein M3256_22935 [Actinomycetota bacterium]|nr:hypothetical protein [Actinomycetota bacterium]MDQ6949034.1 hypothetical protein [Actinomycetota bacterium]
MIAVLCCVAAVGYGTAGSSGSPRTGNVSGADVQLIASKHGNTRPFTARITEDSFFRTNARLENGLIVPANRHSNDVACHEWKDLLTNPEVIKDNSSLHKYFFHHFDVDGKKQPAEVCLIDLGPNHEKHYRYRLIILSAAPATWRFFDVAGDSYTLRVLSAGRHELHYNSDEPEINTIEISTGIV